MGAALLLGSQRRAHLSLLLRQLSRQGAAIVHEISRAASKAVPKLPRLAHVARDHRRHASALAVARFSWRADRAGFFPAWRTLKFRSLNRLWLLERMPEERAEAFLFRRGVFLGGWQFGGGRLARSRRTDRKRPADRNGRD